MKKYDLTIIGGGPAGYVPAIRAAQMGRKVAVIEEEDLGGTCLNRGCIPTKTLVASTSLLRHASNARKFGLKGQLSFDWKDLAKRKKLVVNRLRKGIEAHFQHLGIDLICGHGAIVEPGLVNVGDEMVHSGNILLSPGSIPLLPGPFAIKGAETSRDILDWDTLPKSLIIVGGGVIGCEFASIFSALGVKITIVEMLPGILPGIDEDLRVVVESALRRYGVEILTGKPAENVSMNHGLAEVFLTDGTLVKAERLLVAIGRRPRLEGLGLQEAGIDSSSKGITTDLNQMTNLPGVYAAGDATGKWQLAHAGSAQALSAVEHMFDMDARIVNPDAMPGCIFTSPEIAIVGPGQDEWEQRGVPVRSETVKYIANGKAVGMNETAGLLKMIVRNDDQRIIGIQIVGADASSLIGEAVLAVNLGLRPSEIGRMVHPHPTLSELFMEAGEAFGPGAIHG